MLFFILPNLKEKIHYGPTLNSRYTAPGSKGDGKEGGVLYRRCKGNLKEIEMKST
jgi:hypothetical protein